MEQLAFPRYDAYKTTGVQWLGDIPQHWELKKNKFLFTEQKATVGKRSADFTLLSLTLKGVIARDMENPQGKFPAEFNTYKIVKPDDLIFCLFDIEETPRTVGRSTQPGMITGAYDVMECHPDVSARYLSYYYLSLDRDKRLKPLYTGLRKVIQRDTFMGIKTPVPPRDEQDRIANFLDQKTAEIDEAIVKKQRLIELLKEQKAILINQAVTKGLTNWPGANLNAEGGPKGEGRDSPSSPDVPMRDSGVEWIGEVPEHWELTRLKFATKFIVDCLHATPTYEADGEYPAIRTADIVPGVVKVETARKVSIDTFSRWTERAVPEQNDILYSREGERYGIAAPVPAAVDLCISQRMMHFRANEVFDPIYLMWQLNCQHVYGQASVDTTGATSPHVNISTVKNYLLVVPPIGEQVAINEYVELRSGPIEVACSKTQEEIGLLQELKAALIADAATGKIKL